MIRIAICDDQPEDARGLERLLLERQPGLPVRLYASAQPLLWDLETGNACFELFFLDICLPGTGGLEAARRIRARQPDALIVFVSTSREFYREAYDLFAFNYLEKPVDPARLGKVLDRALDQLAVQADQKVSFSFRSREYSVRCADILYVSSAGHQLTLHLRGGGALPCYGKLAEFAERLPGRSFVRCHQSYLVNLGEITALEPGGFRVGGALVPISKSYSQAARAAYRAHLFQNFD
ncbi:LytR/AlgR family response regulator transcription factor [Allofournierella sp.]|uniref:LytR/AlgR family response regulator transcription factor n=1 Tax=Allofournierella sp. TaxID=1940256 RepID=UPI003AB591F7